MKWSNVATQCVADIIWNERVESEERNSHHYCTTWGFLEEEAEQCRLDGVGKSKMESGLVERLRYFICGEPGMSVDGVFRENADQESEVFDLVEVTGIDLKTVDWLQIVRWLLGKMENNESTEEGNA